MSSSINNKPDPYISFDPAEASSSARRKESGSSSAADTQERAIIQHAVPQTLEFPSSRRPQPILQFMQPHGKKFNLLLATPDGTHQLDVAAQAVIAKLLLEAAVSHLPPEGLKNISAFSIDFTKKKVEFFFKEAGPWSNGDFSLPIPFKDCSALDRFKNQPEDAGQVIDPEQDYPVQEEGAEGTVWDLLRSGSQPALVWENRKLPAWSPDLKVEQFGIPETWWRPILALTLAHVGSVDAMGIESHDAADPLEGHRQGLIEQERALRQQLNRDIEEVRRSLPKEDK